MAQGIYGRPQTRESFATSKDSAEPQSSVRTYETDRSDSNVQQQTYPVGGRMASSPERPKPVGHDANAVSPELIAEITERVKRELVEHINRTGNADETLKATSKAPPPPHPAQSMQRQLSNKSSSTSSPPPENRRERVYTPPSPIHLQSQIPKPTTTASATEQVREPSPEPVRVQRSSSPEKPSVRFSDRKPSARPSPSRTFSAVELSTIDQKWGKLFDEEGRPTQRLGQFLRGLANHIIDDFKPQKTIVVTPLKMATYYSTHALDQEPHPLVSIFRAHNNDQISRLYQDLGCQHHLIQDDLTKPPTIPGLTALGFAQWMIIHILAYPEEESKRLEKVVLAMPIDADGEMVDGKPERLPKQISRHLLPRKEDRKSRKLLRNAIDDFLDDLDKSNKRKQSITSPPLSQQSSTSQSRPHPVEIHQVKTSPTRSQPVESKRSSYVEASSPESSSNEGPIKIERDRQPYTAQPGSGKIYAEGSSLNASRLSRANSTSVPRTRNEDPIETHDSRHRRAKSNASQSSYVPPPRAGGRRPSSPVLKKYSDSTPINLDAGGAARYASSTTMPSSSLPTHSSSFPPPPPSAETRENRERRRRRGTNEDARVTGEFTTPKDVERWERYHEAQGRESDRPDRPYERASVSTGPRDARDSREPSHGAGYEDWVRDKPREPRGTSYTDSQARNH